MSIFKRYFVSIISKKVRYRYYVYLPDGYKATIEKKWPLLLFLHGMGQRGNDLKRVGRNGPLRRLKDKIKFPFIIVAPQCPYNKCWDADSLISLLDHIQDKYRIDHNRIYLTGLSMGGSGVWSLANAYPDRFAAIAPVCAFFALIEPNNFRKLPIWCFHGALDDVAPITDSLRMINSIRQYNSTIKVTLYPDVGHNSWIETYKNPNLYKWFLAHKRRT